MLFIGIIIGFVLGTAYFMLGQYTLEKGYVRNGVAKILNHHYKITEIK